MDYLWETFRFHDTTLSFNRNYWFCLILFTACCIAKYEARNIKTVKEIEIDIYLEKLKEELLKLPVGSKVVDCIMKEFKKSNNVIDKFYKYRLKDNKRGTIEFERTMTSYFSAAQNKCATTSACQNYDNDSSDTVMSVIIAIVLTIFVILLWIASIYLMKIVLK